MREHDIRRVPEQPGPMDVEPTLQEQLQLMTETDPKVLEGQIMLGAIDARSNGIYRADDVIHIHRAVGIVKDLYGDKERRYSKTPSLLHPFRVTLAGDNSAAYKVLIRLLHDTAEDFDLTPQNMIAEFGSNGELVAAGVDAITKRKGESYRDYLSRLRDVAESVPNLSHLVADKSEDMINNCIDPFGLPNRIPRSADTKKGMTIFLNKIDTHAEEFFDGYPVLYRRVMRAVDLGRQGLMSPNLSIAA